MLERETGRVFSLEQLTSLTRPVLEAVIRIERETFQLEALSRKRLHGLIQENPELFIIARKGKALVGYIAGDLWDRNGEIVSLAVREKSRGQGIGTALTGGLIKIFEIRGVGAVWLMVKEENEPARRMYERLGFSKVEEVPGYYGDSSVGIKMKLGLSGDTMLSDKK